MSSFSSDSEDDLYTNTASLFKKITKKVNIEITDVLDTTADEIDLTRNKRKAYVTIDEDIEIISKESNEESTAVDLEKSTISLDESTDVIENINACLERNKKGRGRRKSRGGRFTRVTRSTNKKRKSRNKSKKNPHVIASIEIDVDYPIINTVTDLGEEITVKVLWKSQCLKRFDLHKKQKLDTIYKYYSEKENVSEDLLYFSVNDTMVCKVDTPESLNLNAASIIDGGILSTKTYLSSGYKQDKIELKIQWKNLKKPFIYNISVTDNMTSLIEECAKQMNISSAKLKLYFDGELIEPTDTPSSLELEGGECIDCVEK